MAQLRGWQLLPLLILGGPVILTSLVISLTVNAVVTGSIVFSILKVYWEVRSTFKGRTLRVGGSQAKV